jgi:hypothetical protein
VVGGGAAKAVVLDAAAVVVLSEGLRATNRPPGPRRLCLFVGGGVYGPRRERANALSSSRLQSNASCFVVPRKQRFYSKKQQEQQQQGEVESHSNHQMETHDLSQKTGKCTL